MDRSRTAWTVVVLLLAVACDEAGLEIGLDSPEQGDAEELVGSDVTAAAEYLYVRIEDSSQTCGDREGADIDAVWLTASTGEVVYAESVVEIVFCWDESVVVAPTGILGPPDAFYDYPDLSHADLDARRILDTGGRGGHVVVEMGAAMHTGEVLSVLEVTPRSQGNPGVETGQALVRAPAAAAAPAENGSAIFEPLLNLLSPQLTGCEPALPISKRVCSCGWPLGPAIRRSSLSLDLLAPRLGGVATFRGSSSRVAPTATARRRVIRMGPGVRVVVAYRADESSGTAGTPQTQGAPRHDRQEQARPRQREHRAREMPGGARSKRDRRGQVER